MNSFKINLLFKTLCMEYIRLNRTIIYFIAYCCPMLFFPENVAGKNKITDIQNLMKLPFREITEHIIRKISIWVSPTMQNSLENFPQR